ncbi:hypothetical protein SAY87_023520 [Trapa incisa]|uniref:UspA domain-containing protein n=1 Tax=Trapa incisa TaxID=236973 RepID=A0AAN7L1D5_9MYRT|nr:hypothetical protein SAY87_023520 [Trapa incisa]
MADGEKQVMVVGFDGSEHSVYALEWTLDRFMIPYGPDYPFKLLIVYARQATVSAVCIAGPGAAAADFLPVVEDDMQKAADRVLDNAKQICESKSVTDHVVLEVGKGDPRDALCEAVDKHHAAILVLGSHGYGAVKRLDVPTSLPECYMYM